MSGPAWMTLTLRNRLEEIERVSGEVEAFATEHGVPVRDAFDANLALDEVLTNVISYAWDDELEHEIVVRLGIDDVFFVVEVEDDGRPFDPLAASEPDLALPAGERPIGGLGLSLVRKLMPELAYERRGERNVLRMARAFGEAEETVRGAAAAPADFAPAFVLRPTGRLDTAGAAALEETLLARIAAGERRVVVDCSSVAYINSAGLRTLLVAAKRLKAAGGTFAVVAPAGQVRSVLEMSGFDAVFPIHE
jgi:serine/threonine-protein kinase RsbW